QSYVLDGDNRLIREGLEEFDLHRSEGAHLAPACSQSPNEFALLSKGGRQKGSKRAAGAKRREFSLLVEIGNVERAMFAHPAKLRLIKTDVASSDSGNRSKMSARHEDVRFGKSQQDIVDPTHPGGALHDGIKNWLHVRRRAADDTKHLGRRGLMFQSLAQFRIALLQFFEQPHVLDGNYGLVGKGLKQSDLLVGEWTNLRAANRDSPDGNTFAK